jgi:aromatic-amino-acid transaminase
MLEVLTAAPEDAILALVSAFRNDPREDKIDLGVGVYRDSAGRTPVLAAVREAEQRLHDSQTSKVYVGIAGDHGFNYQMARLVFGDALPEDRLRAVQTPGGGGGVRILAELVKRAAPAARLWLSEPTWPNHAPIAHAAGLEVHRYPYFDPATKDVRGEAMLAALATAGPGDVVVLHGCCHNPTGAELAAEHWQAIGELAVERGFLPFVDFAYQGFGDGLEEDAFGVRCLAAQVPEMLVAASCSKNFGLYRDRVGTAFILARTPPEAETALGQLSGIIRANYSMPPDHGAAVARIILEDATLRDQWVDELDRIRARMLALREALAGTLREKTGTDDYDFLARHRGMFSLIGTTPEQVDRLRAEHAIYLVRSGRINVAGLREDQIDRFTDALLAVA